MVAFAKPPIASLHLLHHPEQMTPAFLQKHGSHFGAEIQRIQRLQPSKKIIFSLSMPGLKLIYC